MATSERMMVVLWVVLLCCGGGILPVIYGAPCPPKCGCDELNLRVICSRTRLEVVPITFNPKLRYLQLDGNEISRTSDTSLGNYPNLTYLDLSHNLLEIIRGNTLKDLTQLQVCAQPQVS